MFEPTFNRAIKLRSADPRITSDAGALLLREADHRLGLTADLATQLRDDRDPQRIRYEQVELLRQHLYALALGYAHPDDQDALAHDVALKLSVWDRPGRRGLQERSRPVNPRTGGCSTDWRARSTAGCCGRRWANGSPGTSGRRGTGVRSRTGRWTSTRSPSRCLAGRKAGPITATTARRCTIRWSPASAWRARAELEAAELALILEGIDLAHARRRPRWQPQKIA